MTMRPGARWLSVLMAMLATLALSPTAAMAHAELATTTPSQGANVDTLQVVSITFTEPVELLPDAVRTFATDGSPAGDGTTIVDGAVVTYSFATPLVEGAWVTSWRVVSLDGHPIEGAFTFAVGDAVAGAAPTTASSVDILTASLRTTTTALTALALLGLAGALLSRRFVVRRAHQRGRVDLLARQALAIGLGATLVALPVQAAVLLDVPLVRGLLPSSLAALSGTSVGLSAIVRVIALVVARWAIDRLRPGLALAASAVALGSLAMTGHTRTIGSAGLLTLSDVTHLAAGAVWLGGLWVLADALRGSRRPANAKDTADLVARFSGLAVVSVIAVAATGSFMAQAILPAGMPVGSSDYGVALVAKTALVAVLVAFGAFNRVALVGIVERAGRPPVAGGASDVVPTGWALPAAGGRRLRRTTSAIDTLRRTVRVELGLFVLVLVATGQLVDLSPPPTPTSTAVGAYLDLGGGISARFDATVDAAGSDQVRVRLIDALGQPFRTDEVTLLVAQPELAIGQTTWDLAPDVPGIWVADADLLPLAGRWDVDVIVRTSRFEQQSGRVIVDVPKAD